MKSITAPGSTGPATKPLRIGLVTPAWPGTETANGIASAVSHLAGGLTAIGHEVTIIAHWVDAPHADPRVIAVDEKPLPLIGRLLFRLFPDRVIRRATIARMTKAVRQAIGRHRIDVLLMEESFGWAGALRRALPIPVIVTLHGPHWLHRAKPERPRRGPDARRENWEAAGLHRVDGLIAPSRSVQDQTAVEWGLPDLPITVIGNPVSLDATAAPAARLTDPHLLFVGRHDRIKGADVVLAAFARIAARHPACRLTFVGPDGGIAQPDGSTLHLPEAIARLPAALRDRITVLGRKSRAEVEALRRRHPITIIASRYETFGVALIEAMSVGSAVVSTRVGGCAEILRDGETGLLVASEDAGAMAEACLRLLDDPGLALRLGRAAQADVAARFAPETIAREVVAFLAPMLGNR
ncbi:glycosyltransferase family 4 protein [Tabrizicola sp.]|uniref:glycosyltransferase family 4 protein n=1 Tax=Tabrizicola sp. TaxID=2005166 RepID=UPI0025E8AB4C|nr:glycosyltransferase family 4 protein [Tabrizicola sp.]MBY0350369.1 glycosyltransferase family 4 protein [Tabrizicola sp.]